MINVGFSEYTDIPPFSRVFFYYRYDMQHHILYLSINSLQKSRTTNTASKGSKSTEKQITWH